MAKKKVSPQPKPQPPELRYPPDMVPSGWDDYLEGWAFNIYRLASFPGAGGIGHAVFPVWTTSTRNGEGHPGKEASYKASAARGALSCYSTKLLAARALLEQVQILHDKRVASLSAEIAALERETLTE